MLLVNFSKFIFSFKDLFPSWFKAYSTFYAFMCTIYLWRNSYKINKLIELLTQNNIMVKHTNKLSINSVNK